MSKCSNCGAIMTCSCKRRVLENGVMGCTKCVGVKESVEENKDAPDEEGATVKNNS